MKALILATIAALAASHAAPIDSSLATTAACPPTTSSTQAASLALDVNCAGCVATATYAHIAGTNYNYTASVVGTGYNGGSGPDGSCFQNMEKTSCLSAPCPVTGTKVKLEADITLPEGTYFSESLSGTPGGSTVHLIPGGAITVVLSQDQAGLGCSFTRIVGYIHLEDGTVAGSINLACSQCLPVPS